MGISTPRACSEIESRAGRVHALSHAVHLRAYLVQRLSRRQLGAEVVVPAQRAHARRDQVAHSCQSGERRRVGASGLTQPADFCESAGDERSLRVVAESHPVAHAGAQGDDVLQRARQLDAYQVVVGVHAKGRRVDDRLRLSCGGRVFRRHDRRCRHRPDDLPGEIGSRQSADAAVERRHLLGENLAHALAAGQLQPLGGADDDRAVRNRVGDCAGVGPQCLGRHREYGQVGGVVGLHGIGQRVHRLRELDTWDEPGVLPGGLETGRLRFRPREQAHIVTLSREDDAERRSPACGADRRDDGHSANLRPKGCFQGQ